MIILNVVEAFFAVLGLGAAALLVNRARVMRRTMKQIDAARGAATLKAAYGSAVPTAQSTSGPTGTGPATALGMPSPYAAPSADDLKQ